MIKQLAKHAITGTVSGMLRTSVGRYAYEQIVDAAMNRKKSISHNSHKFVFAVPNGLTQYRIDSFSTKEPETLAWIESIPEGSVLWDIGANIGLYSIYAAKARHCRVFAFEPSIFNLELLARNIFLNSLQTEITIVPVALSDKSGASRFKMSTTAWGGALSVFGQDFDQHGALFKDIFEYQTVGVSMLDAVRLMEIPQPRFIKIDVDGIEHLILRGGVDVLSKVEGVLVEINDDFHAQREESARHLESAGLQLYRKCCLGESHQFNQWWVRRKYAGVQG